jgi:hypothetical protein
MLLLPLRRRPLDGDDVVVAALVGVLALRHTVRILPSSYVLLPIYTACAQ